MSQAIPEKYKDLFQKRAFASLSTLMPDGRPQVTPVWCDFDGEHVIFNSARGRQKDRNVRRDPRVSLALIDPENPYRYLEIRGRVVDRRSRRDAAPAARHRAPSWPVDGRRPTRARDARHRPQGSQRVA